MTVLFEAGAVDPEIRGDMWSEALDRFFYPLEVRAPAADFSDSRLEGHRLGPVYPYQVASDRSVVERTSTDIHAHDPERLVVATAVHGRCLIEQGGRRTVLDEGDLSSWDTSHPYRVTHLEPFHLLLVTMPRTLLGARRDAICAQTARRVPADSHVGAIAGPFFRQLWKALEAGAGMGSEDLGDGVIALVRALHGSEVTSDVAARQGPAAALVANIKAYIEPRLSDPGLDPDSIAAANYISTRYLHKLFAGAGTTVSGWVRQRRLEACRRDLCDATLAQHTISEIARTWALPNPAHFSRVFRETYGCTPREMRELITSSPATR